MTARIINVMEKCISVRISTLIILILLYYLTSNVTARSQSEGTHESSEIFDLIKCANENVLDKGIFVGQYTKHLYVSSEPITQKEFEKKLADKEKDLWNHLKTGKLLLGSYDEKFKRIGVSNIEEALKNPDVRAIAERMIEDILEKYRRDWIEKDTELTQSKLIKLYADSTTEQLRLEEWFDKSLFDKGDMPERIYVCSEGTKLGLLGNEIGTINRAQNVFSGTLYMTVNPMIAGTARLMPCFRSEHVHSLKTEASGEGPVMEVVFLRDDRKGGNTHMQILRILPEKDCRAVRNEVYLNGILQRTCEYSNFKEIKPGLWYPLKQVNTDIDAKLPSSLTKRLKTGFLGDLVEEVRNSQIIKQRTEKILELSEVTIDKPIDKNLFQLFFPKGIEVYDYSREDDQGRPFTFITGSETGDELEEKIKAKQ